MSQDVQVFGARLKAERERRGISLDSIAERTKIKKSFLDSLERGDFSRWPAGEVFRRAYVRDYAAAIGVAPEPVLTDFIRLVLVPEDVKVTAEPASLILTFDRSPGLRDRLTSRAALGAIVDVVALLVLGAALSLLIDASIWVTSGMLAFAYYPVMTVFWGRTIGLRWIDGRKLAREAPTGETLRVPGREPASKNITAADAIVDLELGEPLGRLDAVVVEPMLLVTPDGAGGSHTSQPPAANWAS